MITDTRHKVLIYGLASICAALVSLSLFLLIQDPKIRQDSLYGAPLGQDRLVSALQAKLSSDLDTIEAHASALLDRNPRKTSPRGALASVYVQRGQIEAFERVFYPLFAVDGRNSAAYASALAIMSQDARVFERAVKKLRAEQPAWGGLYLRRLLSETERDVSDYHEFIQLYPAQQAGFIREVMAKLGVEQAYASFTLISDRGQSSASGLVDPEFKEELLSWPFGWLLDRETASRESGGGLAIVYFGRGTPVIAQQIARAEPGPYALVMQANGEASLTKGYFKLDAKCWQGRTLAELTLDDVSAAPMQIDLTFNTSDVPDCGFIHIRLMGQAGAFPAPIRLRVQSIDLRADTDEEGP
jgi:hypothetical protein